ncbi:MAG: thiamine phosphate synthase [Nitrospirota bacterium]|nr:thiamine phosphate synthase [Nitrospirota bacterium]
MNPVDFNLLLITDRHVVRTGGLIAAVEQALSGGVRCVQLREKEMPVRELLALAHEMRELTSRYNARLIINDRVDVAIAVGADGVHLGGESMPVRAVRKITGTSFIVGVSTHAPAEAVQAEADGADYVTFGPVYATPSKMKYGPPVGLNALRECCKKVKIPALGLGGIKKESAREVLDAGAYGIAMISAILAAEDVRKAAEGFCKFSPL